MAYENIWEGRGVYRKFSGRVTGMEVLRAVERVEGDHRFDSIRYVINDFLDVTEIDMNNNDVVLIAAIDNVATHSNPKIKVAQITRDQKVKELAEIYAETLRASSYPNMIFSNAIEAREWVGS